MTYPTLIILSLITLNSFGQKATFKYETELCSCEATFDSTKYTRAELKNTKDHLWWWGGLSGDATAWKLEGIKDLDPTEINDSFSKKMALYNGLSFVQDTFWIKMKADLIAYYKSASQLKTLTIAAYENPDTLMYVELVDSNCIYYRDALIAGGDKLLAARYSLNEKQKANNGSPERLQRIYESEMASDQKYEYARLEIMRFGWWNSANHMLPHIGSHNFHKEFERLFMDVKCECDEP